MPVAFSTELISYTSWQKCGACSSALYGRLIPLRFDMRLEDASGSAASRFCSRPICFMWFRICCNKKKKQRLISGRPPSFPCSAHYLNGMCRCSPWELGDRGPPKPLGPIHSVTLFPPLAMPLTMSNQLTQEIKWLSGQRCALEI